MSHARRRRRVKRCVHCTVDRICNDVAWSWGRMDGCSDGRSADNSHDIVRDAKTTNRRTDLKAHRRAGHSHMQCKHERALARAAQSKSSSVHEC